MKLPEAKFQSEFVACITMVTYPQCLLSGKQWPTPGSPSVRDSLVDFLENVHDDFIKWKHFLCYWPFVWGINWSPVNSPHKGQWHGALMFSLICVWINGWVNNHESGDLRCYHAHYDIIVMLNNTKKHLSHVSINTKSYHAVNSLIWNTNGQ